MSFALALHGFATGAGARRQGSSTSALARGLDCERRHRFGYLEEGEGENDGLASETMPQLQERKRHRFPDTSARTREHAANMLFTPTAGRPLVPE